LFFSVFVKVRHAFQAPDFLSARDQKKIRHAIKKKLGTLTLFGRLSWEKILNFSNLRESWTWFSVPRFFVCAGSKISTWFSQARDLTKQNFIEFLDEGNRQRAELTKQVTKLEVRESGMPRRESFRESGKPNLEWQEVNEVVLQTAGSERGGWEEACSVPGSWDDFSCSWVDLTARSSLRSKRVKSLRFATVGKRQFLLRRRWTSSNGRRQSYRFELPPGRKPQCGN